MIYLETSRLILRNYQTTDFADIMVYFSNEEVCKYEDFYPMSDEQVRKIISEWKKMDNRLVVELKSKGIVIGSIGYWVDDEGHYCIDYDFNPKYGGNGYATEAGNALVSYLFKEIGIESIYGDCDIRNVSSWMLLERLGFQRMQKLDNQSYKNDKDGKPIIISTFLYGLKKVDFDFGANKEKKIEKQKRIVFLDIDGVLNSNFWNENHQREISDGTLIDESKIKLLCKLINNTDAQIILHSGWKYWFDSDLKPLRKEAENLRALLEQEGVTISGVTPDHATEEIRRTKKFSLVKAGEILEWLEQYNDVDAWVVLDDLDLHNAEIEKHQIRTDQSVGLTDEDVEKAKEKLLK